MPMGCNSPTSAMLVRRGAQVAHVATMPVPDADPAQRRRPAVLMAAQPHCAPDLERHQRRAHMFAAVAERYGTRVARELQRRHGKTGARIERAYAAALGVADDQATRAHRDIDRVTIMQCALGCRATKRVMSAGILAYACGKWFATTEAEVAGIAGLAGLLNQIEPEPRRVRDPRQADPRARTQAASGACSPRPEDAATRPTSSRAARKWVAFDFDSFDLPAASARSTSTPSPRLRSRGCPSRSAGRPAGRS